MFEYEWEAWTSYTPPSVAELDRIAALDLSCDPDQPPPEEGMPIEARVLLIDPTLPDESAGPEWWVHAASLTPTGYLLDALDQIPVDELDPEQALHVSVAAERLAAKAYAIQAKAIGRFARLRPRGRGEPDSGYAPNLSRYAPDELGLALAISRQAAGHKLALAWSLTAELPATLQALDAGRIDVRKAQVIAEGTAELTPEQAGGGAAGAATRG